MCREGRERIPWRGAGNSFQQHFFSVYSSKALARNAIWTGNLEEELTLQMSPTWPLREVAMPHAFAHGINASFRTAAARPPGPGPAHLHSLAPSPPVLASEPCPLPLRHQLLSSWGFQVHRLVTPHSALDDSREWLPLSIQSPSCAPASAKPPQAAGLASPFQRFPTIVLHPFSWLSIRPDAIALFLIFIFI